MTIAVKYLPDVQASPPSELEEPAGESNETLCMWTVESQIYGLLFIGSESEAREYYERATVERKGEKIVLRGP